MRNKFFILSLVFIGFFICSTLNTYGQEKEKKKKKDFKKTIYLSADIMRASIETALIFQSNNDILSVKIGLENNLGLDRVKYFSHGSVLWRITERSGLYGSYYRILRNRSVIPQHDIPYLDKLIPAGTPINLYFNTNVTSIGYIFTLVSDKKSYLGVYANMYLMSLRTGVSSEGIILNENISLLAPLPNFGVLMMFKVTPWLVLRGNFGYFFLAVDDFQGKITEVNVGAQFKVYKWLSLNLTYRAFDLSMDFKTSGIQSRAEYNFRGPAVGVSLSF